MFYRGSYRKNGYLIPARTLSELKLRIIYTLKINFKYDTPIDTQKLNFIRNDFKFPEYNTRFGSGGNGIIDNLEIKCVNNINRLNFIRNDFKFPEYNTRFGSGGNGITNNLEINYKKIEINDIKITLDYYV